MSEQSDWFVEAFRADYLRVYPHRDVQDARREARFLVRHGARGRVLDLCCGFGRHVLALRELGVEAVGVDLSRDLLRHATTLPGGELLAGRLVRGDARHLPFPDGSLDAVVSLFSSFGYFGDEGDRSVLLEARRVLRTGGLLVLDLMDPTRVRESLEPESSTESSGYRLDARRSIDAAGRHVVKDVRLTRPDGRTREWQERVRMYETPEIRSRLEAAGFEVLRVHGDFEGAAHSAGAPRQIVVARESARR